MSKQGVRISAFTWPVWLRLAAALSAAYFVAHLLLRIAAAVIKHRVRIPWIADLGSASANLQAAVSSSSILFLSILAGAAALRIVFFITKLLRLRRRPDQK